jgi:hypothetical protein
MSRALRHLQDSIPQANYRSIEHAQQPAMQQQLQLPRRLAQKPLR